MQTSKKCNLDLWQWSSEAQAEYRGSVKSIKIKEPAVIEIIIDVDDQNHCVHTEHWLMQVQMDVELMPKFPHNEYKGSSQNHEN